MADITHAAVAHFKLVSTSDGATGYAAPERGDAPCLIVLTADDRPIVHVRAVRHSLEAAKADLRGGWCGFRAPGLAEAFAIGDRVSLKCGVSGKVLADVPFSEGLLSVKPTTEILTVSDLREHAHRDEVCDDLDLLIPIAVAHLKQHGARRFVEAVYLTFLRRWPDVSAAELPRAPGTDQERVEAYLELVTGSEEYANLGHGHYPGPYHPTFRFDLAAIR